MLERYGDSKVGCYLLRNFLQWLQLYMLDLMEQYLHLGKLIHDLQWQGLTVAQEAVAVECGRDIQKHTQEEMDLEAAE